MAATCTARRLYNTSEFGYADGVFSAFASDLPRFDAEPTGRQMPPH